jgi:hypothetical protein
MDITHVRIQHPSGQGFFHSASISVDKAEIPFRYVYDCGTSAGAKARNLEIEAMRRRLGDSTGLIDVVFVSHAHEDHINGLPLLLGKSKNNPIRAGALVLPYLDTVARLIAVAPNLANSRNSLSERFAIEGTRAFTATLNVERIVEVYSSSDIEGLPPGVIVDSDFDPGPPFEPDSGVRLIFPRTFGRRDRDEDIFISDNEPLTISARGGEFWQLRMHVDEMERKRREGFIDRLGTELGESVLSGVQVIDWLDMEDNRRLLLGKFRKKLSTAYGSIGDLNATSLSLYSGPLRHQKPCRTHEPFSYLNAGCDVERVGWLGTGDARLIDNLNDFVTHFGEQLPDVRTLTIPHHGSRHNSDDRLFGAVRPMYAVAASGRNGSYDHPHSETVHRVTDANAQLVIVNESATSKFVEKVELTTCPFCPEESCWWARVEVWGSGPLSSSYHGPPPIQ